MIDRSVRELFMKEERNRVGADRRQAPHLPPAVCSAARVRAGRPGEGEAGLYISYSFTQKENYGRLLRLLKYLKLNAVIINLKDDYGSIRVPVSDPFVRQVPGSVNPYVNVLEDDQPPQEGRHLCDRPAGLLQGRQAVSISRKGNTR